MRLELLHRHRIRDPGLGLNEPSGLTLNGDGSALYTVSDDTKAIFRLDLKGRVSVSDSFFIGLDDLEGIAIRGDDSELLVVQEGSNSVVVVDLNTRRERSRRPLSAMTNYDTIAHHFSDPPDNNGLEGITVNTRNDHVFVVKEQRQPGLLIELDSSLTTILSTRVLQAQPRVHPSRTEGREAGFLWPELRQEQRHPMDRQRQGPVPVPIRLDRRHCAPAPRSHHQHGRQAKTNPKTGGCCLRS